MKKKEFRLKIIIVLSVFLFYSCNKKIHLVFSDNVNNALMCGFDDVKKWEKDTIYPKIFAVIDIHEFDDCQFTIRLNRYERCPPSILKLINRSNRFFTLSNGLKIPVVSLIDSKANFFPKNDFYGLLYGYFIKIGNDDNVIYTGWLY